jgi:hypothetical protein
MAIGGDAATEALRQVDEELDRAWRRGAGLDEVLDRACRVSVEVGRDPMIELAKVAIAGVQGCAPSAAFEVLTALSQHTNRKVAEVARALVTGEHDVFLADTAGYSR